MKKKKKRGIQRTQIKEGASPIKGPHIPPCSKATLQPRLAGWGWWLKDSVREYSPSLLCLPGMPLLPLGSFLSRS